MQKKNPVQSGVKNVRENISIIGDRRLGCSGFIELIGVAALMMREACSLVPVLHFVYVSKL